MAIRNIILGVCPYIEICSSKMSLRLWPDCWYVTELWIITRWKSTYKDSLMLKSIRDFRVIIC